MESVGEVVVAEPDDGVLAGEDSFEQGQVGSGYLFTGSGGGWGGASTTWVAL